MRARRAVAREPVPVAFVSLVRAQPPPLRRLLRARRDHRAVRRRGRVLELQGRPGRRAATRAERAGRRQRVHLRQADRRAARGAQRAAGADRARRRAARRTAASEPMHTSKDYFPSQDPSLGPVSRFFDGEATTEVALDASLGKDIWAAVAPDIAKLRPRIEEGDRLFANAARRPHGRAVERVPRARAARADRPLREQPAAGALPVRGQPDGDLDLDRRADRAARRLHRRLADAARADADRERPLRRPRRHATCASTFLLVRVRADPARGRGARCCSSRARCARSARAADETLEAERAELEALKEAKYREIRDAELDYRTGKLSDADWQVAGPHAARRGRRDPQAAGSAASESLP